MTEPEGGSTCELREGVKWKVIDDGYELQGGEEVGMCDGGGAEPEQEGG